MTVINEEKQRVLLSRMGSDPLWKTIAQHYAGEDPRRWKRLAMIALYECAEWPIGCIARLFGHTKGHVSRTIEKTRAELRRQFADGRKQPAGLKQPSTSTAADEAA